MNNPNSDFLLHTSDVHDAYEELLLQWSNDAFFGDDDDESLAAVYAAEIAR